MRPDGPVSSPSSSSTGPSGAHRAIRRVAIVGGLSRASHDWARAAAELGVVLEHHNGRTAGNRASALVAMVRRADVVITLTVPNSHGAVAIARKAAAAYGRVFILVKRLNPHALADALAHARTPEAP